MVDSWFFNVEILDVFGVLINDGLRLFNNFLGDFNNLGLFNNFLGDLNHGFFNNFFCDSFCDFFGSFNELSLRFSDITIKIYALRLLGFGSDCIGGKK